MFLLLIFAFGVRIWFRYKQKSARIVRINSHRSERAGNFINFFFISRKKLRAIVLVFWILVVQGSEYQCFDIKPCVSMGRGYGNAILSLHVF